MARRLIFAGFLSAAIGTCVPMAVNAASQGQIGAISMGSIEIGVTKAPAVFVAGSADIVFAPTDVRSGRWVQDQLICVHGRGVAGYRLDLVGGASMDVQIDGHSGAVRPIAVKGGELGCNAGERSTLRLTGVDARDQSTLTLLVVPE